MFVTGFFQRHCSHDSPVDVVFLISLAVQFLCVSRFCFLCVVWRGVCVYVYVHVYVYVYVCVCVCAVCCVTSVI